MTCIERSPAQRIQSRALCRPDTPEILQTVRTQSYRILDSHFSEQELHWDTPVAERVFSAGRVSRQLALMSVEHSAQYTAVVVEKIGSVQLSNIRYSVPLCFPSDGPLSRLTGEVLHSSSNNFASFYFRVRSVLANPPQKKKEEYEQRKKEKELK